MRRTAALIFALIGMFFIDIAIRLDLEAIKDVLREAIEKSLKDKSPTRKPDLSGLNPEYDDIERYTIEDFEEPY